MAKKNNKEVQAEKPQERPLPVVTFNYPLHGEGKFTKRFVRVTEMDDETIKGFEIESEFDEEPGKFKSYTLEKTHGEIALLHVAPLE